MNNPFTLTHDATLSPLSSVRLRGALRYAVPVGRALFAAIFVTAGFSHFSAQAAGYAASQGVPLAHLAVPLSGVLALAGGLSVLFGLYARIGAALLAAFLVPVTVMMHAFWNVADPMAAQLHQAMFFKNLALLGGTFLILHFGAGPLSIDAYRQRSGARARAL